MIKADIKNVKNLSQSDKQLLLGNILTWGSIIASFTLAIFMAPADAAEGDLPGASMHVESSAQDDLNEKVSLRDQARIDAAKLQAHFDRHLSFANF